MLNKLSEKTYDEWLKSLSLFSLGKNRLKGDLTPLYSFTVIAREGRSSDLFSLMTRERGSR